jgi:hypothetical protein
MISVVVAKEAEVGVHPADIHVVRPHHEAEAADGRPNHHPMAKMFFLALH